MPGYIKIHRKITEWEWYSDINTTRIFIHLLLTACFKDTKYKGKTLNRGSLITTISKLSDETGLTVREVRTALEHLKSTGEVEIKTTNRESIIKVHNYDVYQDIDCDGRQTNDKQTTDERHSNDERTEEECKEGNNIFSSAIKSHDKKKGNSQKRIYADDSQEMQLALLLSSEILKNNPDWILRGGIQSWCDTFRLILERDKRDYADVVSMIKFRQWSEFWRGNILSAKKLREQYDTLSFKREEARRKFEKYNG